MSGPFKVGEICVLKNDPSNTDDGLHQYDGEEVEIIAPLSYCWFDDGTFGFAYGVRVPGGRFFYAFPHELRRRKPPTTGEQSVLAMFKGQPQAVPA